MRRWRFPVKRQPSIPVGDVAARRIVADPRTAGCEQRGQIERGAAVRSRVPVSARRTGSTRSCRPGVVSGWTSGAAAAMIDTRGICAWGFASSSWGSRGRRCASC
jgi:hypothetical protein